MIDQFLQDGSNHRTDQYGGSIENRARFLLEVVDAAISVWGKDRVGIRLSPHGTFNSMQDSNPGSLFTYVLKKLSERGIAYVHLIEPRSSSAGSQDDNLTGRPDVAKEFRQAFKGVIISAGGYDAKMAADAVAGDNVDAVAFGRFFISTPDLVERLRQGKAFNPYDRSTFYGGAEKGYTDYPM